MFYYIYQNYTFMNKSVIVLIGLICLQSCNNKKETTQMPDVVAMNIDTAVSPSKDFFEYANGNWIKQNPIPGEQSSWGIANLVIEENLKRLREISEKAATIKDNPGSSNQKIGDFWSVAMDTNKIEQEGLKPLQLLLDKINAISDINSLINTVAELKKTGSSTLFNDGVGQDAKNSEVMSYQLSQVGIGLSDR